MWWSLLLMVMGSHVDVMNNAADLRVCTAGIERAADQATANGSAEVNILGLRDIAAMFATRLDEIGAADAVALAAARKALTGTPAQSALLDKCGAIVAGLRGDDSLLDAAMRLDDSAAHKEYSTFDEEDTVDAMATEAMAAVELAALSEPRRGEIRCATLAGLVTSEVERGVRSDAHGLTRAGVETLAGRLAEAIMAETALGEDDVRAMYKADFEAFALEGEGKAEADRVAHLEEAMLRCRAFYESVNISGDGDGDGVAA